ncbi:Replication protein A subunit [Quillaja saponaria]|uniref:Replication protein A subunit n=1 Tax=Quillaja saponaria TaxID=32244 RepID=A0AAD7LDS2_QUISA|nr:Replication protein A subunit [Quillaja saponaria]
MEEEIHHDEMKEKNKKGKKTSPSQASESHVLLTGSKLETPITAPIRTPSTTPPARMLSKKFLREGETPDSAASATSGIIIEAVNAAAVNPVTAFSFKDALT